MLKVSENVNVLIAGIWYSDRLFITVYSVDPNIGLVQFLIRFLKAIVIPFQYSDGIHNGGHFRCPPNKNWTGIQILFEPGW